MEEKIILDEKAGFDETQSRRNHDYCDVGLLSVVSQIHEAKYAIVTNIEAPIAQGSVEVDVPEVSTSRAMDASFRKLASSTRS